MRFPIQSPFKRFHFAWSLAWALTVFIEQREVVAQSPATDTTAHTQNPLSSDEQSDIKDQCTRLWDYIHRLEADQKLDAAVAKLQELIPLERRLLGEQNDELATPLAYLGELQEALGDLNAVRANFLRSTAAQNRTVWQGQMAVDFAPAGG